MPEAEFIKAAAVEPSSPLDEGQGPLYPPRLVAHSKSTSAGPHCRTLLAGASGITMMHKNPGPGIPVGIDMNFYWLEQSEGELELFVSPNL